MTVKRATRVSAWSMFGRALRRRCPRCGGRGIFRPYFNMKEHCPTCGLALDRGESEDYWLGAYAINLVVWERLPPSQAR